MQHKTNQSPSVEEAKSLILDTLDGDSIQKFANFTAFYDWLDTTLHYDQADSEESLADSYDTLQAAYVELVQQSQGPGAVDQASMS